MNMWSKVKNLLSHYIYLCVWELFSTKENNKNSLRLKAFGCLVSFLANSIKKSAEAKREAYALVTIERLHSLRTRVGTYYIFTIYIS